MKIVKVTVGQSNGRNKQGIEVEGAALDFENRVKDHFKNCADMSAGYGDWAWITDESHAMQAMIDLGCYDYYTGGVKSVEVVYEKSDSEFADQLHAVLNRMNIAAARLETQQAVYMLRDDGTADNCQYGEPGWNGKTQSPISGPVLHSFNETMLCENYCTDALQAQLADGWRIIAVCPQESRRPDYVLGRCLEAPTIRSSALRG